jgi:voltage-gated potassium channel
MRDYFGIDNVSERQKKIYQIIFESDTKAGKRFDVILFWLILLSILVVMLESITELRQGHEFLFQFTEYVLTFLFLTEYLLRIYCVRHKLRYIFSFYGIIDLLSILPVFISLLIPNAASLLIIRVVRLLRVFRVLKLISFMKEANMLLSALKESQKKIMVFVFAVLSLVVVFGTVMYVIESAESGFTSIPQSIYWAIVTLTTVGYGDIAPVTPLGRALAAVVMILGYAIIAVPTGIVTAQMTVDLESKQQKKAEDKRLFACPKCKAEGHLKESKYCFSCGADLTEGQ